jgi:hypothetical protein
MHVPTGGEPLDRPVQVLHSLAHSPQAAITPLSGGPG